MTSAQNCDANVRAFEQARTDARQALGLSLNDALSLPAFSVVVKYWLMHQVVALIGPLPKLRERLHARDSEERDRTRREVASALYRASRVDRAFLEKLAASVGIDTPLPEVAGAHGYPWWVSRIAQLAYEGIRGEAVAPELQIPPVPLPADRIAEALRGPLTHAVVCGELIGFANELFPLMVDARCASMDRGVNVIGVHCDWLHGSAGVTRSIFYDHAHETLLESELEAPRPIDSVHFLYLGQTREKELHQKLSAQLTACIQLNRYSEARVADSKWKTHQRLCAAGVRTPSTLRIAAAMPVSEVRSRIAAFCRQEALGRFVVQPDEGTEGQGVTCFTCASDGVPETDATKHIERLQKEGDVVVRAPVEGIRYSDSQTSYSADLRVNVAYNGERYLAESGYLQVASDPGAFASSVGRGGRIIALSAGAWAGLGVSEAQQAPILATACRAAEALAMGDRPLALLGVDLKLKREAGGVEAWVLDINPRPAGLSHSELFDSHQPGVSTGLWTGLLSAAGASQKPIGEKP